MGHSFFKICSPIDGHYVSQFSDAATKCLTHRLLLKKDLFWLIVSVQLTHFRKGWQIQSFHFIAARNQRGGKEPDKDQGQRITFKDTLPVTHFTK